MESTYENTFAVVMATQCLWWLVISHQNLRKLEDAYMGLWRAENALNDLLNTPIQFNVDFEVWLKEESKQS